MQIANYPTLNGPQEAALQTLQTAIVRLATKPVARPGAQQRQQLNALVEQALEAYRKYMKAIAA
jgi:hypothetical protein